MNSNSSLGQKIIYEVAKLGKRNSRRTLPSNGGQKSAEE